jgi:hypothetical protein
MLVLVIHIKTLFVALSSCDRAFHSFILPLYLLLLLLLLILLHLYSLNWYYLIQDILGWLLYSVIIPLNPFLLVLKSIKLFLLFFNRALNSVLLHSLLLQFFNLFHFFGLFLKIVIPYTKFSKCLGHFMYFSGV